MLFVQWTCQKKQQEAAVALKYHGGEDNLASQVDKLIAGKGAYSELWENNESETSGPQMVIPQQYHRQSGDLVKGENITKQLLSRTYKTRTNSPMMNGRTIRTLAQDVTREMKKMLSLMPIAIRNKFVTLADGEYVFDISGKTKKNLIEFIISQMYNWKRLYGATAGEGEDGHKESSNTEGGDDDDDLPAAVSTEAEAEEELASPPSDYIPFGLIAFMLWGPLAEKEKRIDIIALDTYATTGRKEIREVEKKKSDGKRDFDLGSSARGGGRGLSLGANSHKEVVLVAQQQERINNQKHEASLIQQNMILTSKNESVKTRMKMVELYEKRGNNAKAEELMISIEATMKLIEFHENKLHELKNSAPSQSVEVEEYLKLGRVAMNIGPPPEKKQKSAATPTTSSTSSSAATTTEDSTSSSAAVVTTPV